MSAPSIHNDELLVAVRCTHVCGLCIGGMEVADSVGGGVAAGAVTFVPWRYGCRHVGEFQGTQATEREIAIIGVTAVEDAHPDDPIFHRFIDWANVFAQLGLIIGARPVVT